MKTIAASSCLVAVYLHASVHAAAQAFLYDNFGPGDSYGSGSVQPMNIFLDPYRAGYSGFAVRFLVPSDSYMALDSVDVAVDGFGQSTLFAVILGDAGGLPGSVLYASSYTSSSGPIPTGIVTFSFGDSILDKGNAYWVKLDTGVASGAINWLLNGSSAVGYASVFKSTEGETQYIDASQGTLDWIIQGGTAPTLRVAATAIPELESTQVVMLTAVGLIVIWRRAT